MSRLPDPIEDGLNRGWQVRRALLEPLPGEIECDVAIVGTGAGAGITAELLTKAGLSVVMIEEGPLKSSRDFRQLEAEAYPSLYQESAARKTADQSINILQGRCVGGSTTVNWTSSFRTPDSTLQFWSDHFGLKDFTPDELSPWFAQAERRLNIGPWLVPPNENNDLLRRGAAQLGISAAAIMRNVKGCWNLGSCGLGCPTNAKQSMLVTTIPAALDAGARLFVDTRAHRFHWDGDRVESLECMPRLDKPGRPASTMKIRARHYVLSAGAINGPAMLLRSGAKDPHGLVGRRTFLHPVVISIATFDHRVEGWSGAPQTIYSDHFLGTHPVDGPIGFKLEAPPLHPVLATSTLAGFGKEQAQALTQFPNTHAILALLRDGFHPESPGGHITLRDDGSPLVHYPLNAFVMEGVRRAYLAMAEIQFAAGATSVAPVHEAVKPYTNWTLAKEAIANLDLRPLLTRVASAHVMGGCGMSSNDSQGVVRPDGLHWHYRNLSVHDGSIFPTSVGANPQLSIYGIVNRMATKLAKQLTGKDVALA